MKSRAIADVKLPAGGKSRIPPKARPRADIAIDTSRQDAFLDRRNTMNTIVKEVIIPRNRRMNLDIDVPTDLPAGEAVITLTIEPKAPRENPRNRLGDLFGKGKGEVWMADDFDAPLEDFKEYI